jgi:hypothetical protein
MKTSPPKEGIVKGNSSGLGTVIHYKEKRAITFEEHQKIIAAE